MQDIFFSSGCMGMNVGVGMSIIGMGIDMGMSLNLTW